MRLTLCYVSLAVFLEQAQSAPMLGLPSLPLVGQPNQLLGGIAQTGLPIVGQVGGLSSGLFNSPLLGSIGNIVPITSVFTGGGRRAQRPSPLTGLVGALPVPGMLPSLKKREPQGDPLGLGNLIGTLPLLGPLLEPQYASGQSTSLLGSLLGTGPSPSNTSGSASSPPTSGLSGLLSGLLKREPQGDGSVSSLKKREPQGLLGLGNLLSSLPLVGPLLGGGSIPLVGPLLGVSPSSTSASSSSAAGLSGLLSGLLKREPQDGIESPLHGLSIAESLEKTGSGISTPIAVSVVSEAEAVQH